MLDDFFAALQAVSPELKMVLTTASNPENRRVVRRLHKAMVDDEQGKGQRKGFLQMREEHIRSQYPDMSDKEANFWARSTRGLIYDDVTRAVEARTPNLLHDMYNTCNPATGSWTERILPLEDYRQLLLPYGRLLTVLPGSYNTYRRGPKAWVSRRLNRRIAKASNELTTGDRPNTRPRSPLKRRRLRRALKVAPFIYLLVH